MKFMRLVAVPMVLLALSACNGSDSGEGVDYGASPDNSSSAGPDASSTPTAEPDPTGPECTEIWADGATLPADYEGCLVDGAYGTQDDYPCLDGTKLVVFDNAFYAVTGGTIREPDIAPLQDTEEYGAVYADCTGE